MPKALMFVGSCNSKLGYVANPSGRGISAYRVDLETGAADALSHEGNGVNPTFVRVAPDGRSLLATNELPGVTEGLVSAYSVDAATGQIGLLGRIGTRGYTPAHVDYDRTGRFAAVANYGDAPASAGGASMVVLKLTPEGGIAEICGDATHSGTLGPDTARQEVPHSHCVRWSPDNRFVLVADLGLDRIMVHRFDAASGALAPHGEAVLTPGSGPRHFIFHPNGRIVYVANELIPSVTSFAFEPTTGRLTELGSSTTLPAGTAGVNYPSAIQVDPSGRFVLVANRVHGSIGRLRIGADGAAGFEDVTSIGGTTPRDFAFDPSGRIVAVANQESDRVDLFRWADGRLAPLNSFSAGSPTAIAFHPELA